LVTATRPSHVCLNAIHNCAEMSGIFGFMGNSGSPNLVLRRQAGHGGQDPAEPTAFDNSNPLT